MTASSELENLTFILGGARSGKSTLAEKLAAEYGGQVLYVATAEVRDGEMKSRIEQHKQRRPAEWDTLEAPISVAASLEDRIRITRPSVVLLDCLSLLVSNALLSLPEGKDEAYYWGKMQPEIHFLLKTVAAHPEIQFIFVSNEVGEGIVPAYPLGRSYRDLLGRVNQSAASCAARVRFMIAGIPLSVK